MAGRSNLPRSAAPRQSPGDSGSASRFDSSAPGDTSLTRGLSLDDSQSALNDYDAEVWYKADPSEELPEDPTPEDPENG